MLRPYAGAFGRAEFVARCLLGVHACVSAAHSLLEVWLRVAATIVVVQRPSLLKSFHLLEQISRTDVCLMLGARGMLVRNAWTVSRAKRMCVHSLLSMI